MKIIKIFTVILLLSLAIYFVPTLGQAQENNEQYLTNILAEFETDQIDADNLNIEEPNTLPGEWRYNWQLFKENLALFFTFDEEKKINKLEEISNRRLLEAKMLTEIGTDNAANRIQEALNRYDEVRQKISDNLETNPTLQEKLLEKLDANQLKHQQILSMVSEKLRDKIPEADLEKIQNIKINNALRWYNVNQEQIQSRLEKAVDNNNVGSKFKQLQNIASLEELMDQLPEESKAKIEAAKTRAEARLANRLENSTGEDREKFETYISQIEIPELIKQRLISNLKDSQELPEAIRKRASSIYERLTDDIRDSFADMTDEEQRKFLEQFENQLAGHPAYIQILENLNSTTNKARIQNVLEIQNQRIKETIQNTTDPIRLRAIEQNVQNYPSLKKQVQEQQRQIKATPTPLKYNTNITPRSTTVTK